MRRLFLLIIWLAGILIPLGWFGRFSASYQRAFDAAFGSETMHVLMHFILYTSLVIITIWTFQVSIIRRSWLVVLVLVLMVGMSQELLQAWSNGRFLLGSLVYDLSVDLAGGIMGLLCVAAWKRKMP